MNFHFFHLIATWCSLRRQKMKSIYKKQVLVFEPVSLRYPVGRLYVWSSLLFFLLIPQGRRFPKWGGLEKHMFQKALSVVSSTGPTMIGAKGRRKFLNLKGSRSSENATFFEYFSNYFVKILQKNFNL